MLAAAATALLIAPAAFHRMIYRRRLKQHLVHVANKLALSGLVLLLLAMIAALVLILDVTTGIGTAVILASGMLTWFFTWWFILPVYSRLRHSAGTGSRALRYAQASPAAATAQATTKTSSPGET
jgi:hypothetical protein